MTAATRRKAIAGELLGVLGTGGQIEPYAGRHPDFELDEAYDVAAAIVATRVARGERPVGRKLGFTNAAVQAEYGVGAPIWARVFDTTVHDLATLDGGFACAGLPEPRIEPEIVLGFARAPEPGMDEDAIFACLDCVAHGFEIVASVFRGWRFTAAEAVAGFGLHGALLLGPRHAVAADPGRWRAGLDGLSIRVFHDDRPVAEGRAANVLGGPLTAVRFLLDTLADRPADEALIAREFVTTGTLTSAPPAMPGDRWRTELSGIPLSGIEVRFR